MTSKLMLSALAGVAAIAVVAAPQDPSFEYPAARHVGFDQPKNEPDLATSTADQVSVSFKNATIREVLDWLKGQGINFVVQDDMIDKDARVNVNVANQPVEDLMKALASAWSGHWEKRNDIWVFQKGRDVFGVAKAELFAPAAPFVAPSAPGAATLAPVPGRVFVTPGAPGKGGTWVMPAVPGTPMTKEQRQALEKAMQGMDDPKRWEEFSKTWEKWARDYEKNFQEFEKNWKGKEFHMDPKALEEIRSKTLEMSKMKGFKLSKDGKEFMPFEQKDLEKIQRDAVEAAKGAEKMRFYTVPSAPGAKGYMFDGKTMRPMDEKALRALREKSLTRTRGVLGEGPNLSMGMSSHNLKAIYDSLTPAQEQTLKTKGYLNYSDLNSKQRGLLGVITDDSWTISYKTDKVNLTIKSDR